jgi:acetyl-CoA C-acetyltransferase
MVANMVVDQAAAMLVCSSEAAAKYGVAMDRVVYPNVVVEVSKMPMLSNRENYNGVTALGVAGKRALEMADLSIDDISLIDIYSCFPAAVQVGMRELGLGDDATPTLTGGLNHGGGPFNSYVMHSIATAMNKVRDARGEPALVTSLGGWFSKMAFGVYSAEPPRNGYAYACLDDEISKIPSRALSQNVNANSTIETYALSYFEQKPHQAVIACLLDDGTRLFATTDDDDTLEELLRIEPCGRDVAVTTEGKFELR